MFRKALDGGSWGYCVRQRSGSRSPAEYVTDLSYADDIALFSTSFEQADSMLTSVSAAAREAGLGINFAKTEVLVVGDLARAEPTRTLSLDGVQLNRVESFVYLGSKVPSSKDEISRRIQQATFNSGKLRNVWAAPLTRALKVRIFRALVDPILFYACETWTTTKVDLLRLRGVRNRLLRRALEIRWYERVPNSELYKLNTSVAPKIVEERRLRFVGHVTRFVHNPTSLQPINQLLWFLPQGATRRTTHCRTNTFHNSLTGLLGHSLMEVRQMATQCDSLEFTSWYSDRCANRWAEWTTPPPRFQPTLANLWGSVSPSASSLIDTLDSTT